MHGMGVFCVLIYPRFFWNSQWTGDLYSSDYQTETNHIVSHNVFMQPIYQTILSKRQTLRCCRHLRNKENQAK